MLVGTSSARAGEGRHVASLSAAGGVTRSQEGAVVVPRVGEAASLRAELRRGGRAPPGWMLRPRHGGCRARATVSRGGRRARPPLGAGRRGQAGPWRARAGGRTWPCRAGGEPGPPSKGSKATPRRSRCRALLRRGGRARREAERRTAQGSTDAALRPGPGASPPPPPPPHG